MATPPPASSFDTESAIDEIDAIIGIIAGAPRSIPLQLAQLTTGKVYELYVLAKLIERLAARGWHATFHGVSIVLKGSPGMIQPHDAYFEIRNVQGGIARIYTDIQVRTLSDDLGPVQDLSAFHEIDIVVVRGGVSGMPAHDELLLGIECKAVANFKKAIVREVLGRRRELSYFTDFGLPCLLDGTEDVPANPPSEYWLAYIDAAGSQYAQGPSRFGVAFYHLRP